MAKAFLVCWLSLLSITLPAFSSTKSEARIEWEVQVPDTSERHRAAHMQAVLQAYLQHHYRDLPLDQASIQDALAHSEIYISQFSYATRAEHHFFKARFNGPLLRQLTKDLNAGLEIAKPVYLVWLSRGHTDALEWSHLEPDAFKSAERLVRYLQPLLDHEEKDLLEHKIKLGESVASTLDAIGLRYQTANWLWIDLNQAHCVWSSAGQRETITLGHEVLEAQPSLCLAQHASRIERLQAAEVSIDTPALSRVTLRITNLENPRQLAKVQHRLSELPNVVELESSQISRHYCVFELEVRGGSSALKAALDEEPIFEAEAYTSDTADGMCYRLKQAL